MRSGDCVIVGAGVVGLAVAYALARQGASVLVLERSSNCGRGSSAAAAGMLAVAAEASGPGPFLELCRAGAARWREWAPELLELTGVDLELEEGGLLRVSDTDQGWDRLRRRRTWQLAAGLESSELLDRGDLLEVLPALGPEIRGGLFYPEEGHLHSRRAVDALLAASLALGVEVRARSEVTRVTVRERGAELRLSSGAVVDCPQLVLAAGAWSTPLLADLGLAVALTPIKGQMIAGSWPELKLPMIVFGDSGYLLQKRSSLLLAGATEERVGFDPALTPAGRAQLTTMAQTLVPGLDPARFSSSWAGFRPLVGSGEPILGRVAPGSQVLVATGHYRNGVLLAPITGELIAQAISSGIDPPQLAAFSPAGLRSAAAPSRRKPGSPRAPASSR